MVTPTEDEHPDHDGGKFAPIEATTVATWKARAFLENLAVDAEGAVFVTVYSHNRVDRYDPTTGKVVSRKPSSYGWKSENQAGPCCRESDGTDLELTLSVRSGHSAVRREGDCYGIDRRGTRRHPG
jgi:sugar lactone lactonase YvrE